MKKYYVYILLTERNTYYCGYTDDLQKRYKAHLNGYGAKYTRANKPVKLIWQKEFNSKSDAQKEEYRIKQLSRREKEFIINRTSPDMPDL